MHTRVKTCLHLQAWCVSIVLAAAPHSTLAADATPVTDVLTTQAESRISIGLSNYKYHEPSLDVRIYGLRGGIGYYGTKPLAENFFGLLAVDYRFGSLEWTASDSSGGSGGEAKGIPDYYVEGKLAIGRDFTFDSFVLSPYVGLGYRRLFNEFSSASSGYDRTQEYIYLPVGLIHRFSLGSDGMLETTVEGNFLLAGYHKAEFSDFDSNWEDANFKQDSGYGIKASMIYRKGNWGIGPYLNYWNIADSDIDYIKCNIDDICRAFEPANSTVEYGIKVQLSSLAAPEKQVDQKTDNNEQDWSGFYAGVQGSYLTSNVDMTNDVFNDGTFIIQSSSWFPGAVIGVYAGSNFHTSSNVVFGIELDANLTNASFSGDSTNSTAENSYELKGYGSVRLRGGYSYGRMMPYVTAGLATANIEFGSEITDTIYQLEGSGWVYGYTLGAGADYQLDDRFYLRAEYRFTDYMTADIDADFKFDKSLSETFGVSLYSQSLLLGLAMSF